MAAELSVASVCRNVANLLRQERLSQALSLTRVAEKAALSRQMISYVERGLRVPSLDTLLRIARVLEIEPDDLLRRAQRRL